MITLAIEAATYQGSVALLDDRGVLCERSVAMRGREHEALMPAVAEVLADTGIAVTSLERVVCGAGPGAFTSLRIAGGIAKGLALAIGIPLYPVSSLALIVSSHELQAGLYVAAIDAMRGESYVAAFRVRDDGEVIAEGGVSIVPSADIAVAGATLVGPSVSHTASLGPHARGVIHLATLIASAGPADLAGWEPAYGRMAEAQVKWEAEHGRPLRVP